MLLFRRVVKAIKAGRFWRARDGQAALEFLLNYGWAILGVLVVLGGLVRFGVLSPANLVPEKCSFPGSVGCPDFEVGSNGIRLILQNRAGKDIVVSSIGFGSDALSQSSGGCSTGAVNAVVKNGEKATFYANDPINCNFKDTGRPKNKYNVTVAYSFLGSPGISHSLSGELLAKKGEGAVSGGAGEYGGADSSLLGFWAFNEGSGTSASDSSSSGNAGTLTNFGCTTLDCDVNSGWTSAGKKDNAIRFDGVNPGGDYVTVPDNNRLDIEKEITVSAWLIFDENSTWQRPVQKYLPSLGIPPYSIAYRALPGAELGCEFSNDPGGSTGKTVWATSGVLPGTWYHVVCTGSSSGNYFRVYVNGVLAASTTWFASGNIVANAISLNIGRERSGFSFNGIIDEVKIWNRSLSAQEIAALAAQ